MSNSFSVGGKRCLPHFWLSDTRHFDSFYPNIFLIYLNITKVKDFDYPGCSPASKGKMCKVLGHKRTNVRLKQVKMLSVSGPKRLTETFRWLHQTRLTIKNTRSLLTKTPLTLFNAGSNTTYSTRGGIYAPHRDFAPAEHIMHQNVWQFIHINLINLWVMEKESSTLSKKNVVVAAN